MFEKIIVIGCPGAGKSTFARHLRDITGLPLHCLDMMYHNADRTHVTRDTFDTRLGDVLANDRYIIDGNYRRTLERRLMHCDTVFFLDYPVEVCIAGAKARVGKVREDMPWVEETLDEEFRQTILDYPEQQRPYIYELLTKHREGKEIIVFRSREEAAEYLNTLHV